MTSSINENLFLENYIVNLSLLGRSPVRNISNYSIVTSFKRIDYDLLLELPIYRTTNTRYVALRPTQRLLYSKHYNIEYTYLPVYKSFGKSFMGLFKEGGNLLYKISVKNHPDIFVSKGIITTEDLHPLILVTTKLDPLNMLNDNYCISADVDFKNITIYINRCVFTNNFHERYRGLSNAIKNKILPELMIMPVKIEIKDNLDIWSTVNINPNSTSEDYKNLLIDSVKDITWDLS